MAATESLKRRRSETTISFDDAPVKVVVGSEKKCFYVHASALTATSEFFKSALKKEWTTTDERIVDLCDEKAGVFISYVQWLYSGEITTGNVPESNNESELVKSRRNHYIELAELYALGERLNDITFQDSVINAIVFASREKVFEGKTLYPGAPVINIIYGSTTNDSPARRVLVNFYVRYGNEKFQVGTDEVNHEFLSELSRALLKDRVLLHKDEKNYTALVSGVPCSYHNHEKGKPCHFK